MLAAVRHEFDVQKVASAADFKQYSATCRGSVDTMKHSKRLTLPAVVGVRCLGAGLQNTPRANNFKRQTYDDPTRSGLHSEICSLVEIADLFVQNASQLPLT